MIALTPIRRPLALCALLLSVLAAADEPRLANGRLDLAFDAQTGGLTEFRDTAAGHNFIAEGQAGSVWRLEVAADSGNRSVAPPQAGRFRWQRIDGVPERLELVWEGFDGAGAPGLRVTVTVSLDESEPVSHWGIAVDGGGQIQPTAVHFPRILPIAAQEREVLAVPYWMGEKSGRARELLCGGAGNRWGWEYPGTLSMQCLAFYSEGGPGLYLASDDASALAKRFACTGSKDEGLGLELTQLPEKGMTSYQSPYLVSVGAFEGDWFTVARRYRQWALEQPWVRESRRRTGGTADWVADTGLWIWNRGRSGGVLEPAVALAERAGMPVSVFWHWWHGCPYDAGFPEYLPPREGEESFKAAVAAAQAKGVHAIVYMNQRLWGMTTESWKAEGAERYAVKGSDGKVAPEVYNTFMKVPCASMCMGTPFWRDTYAGLAAAAVTGLGVDGIYMDQACSSLACFDPTHGHPLGGGAYWMDGFRRLQADIRERCAGTRQVVLAGEGCGETWLPYLDLMLSLQVSMERYKEPGAWEPIPFFHAVYHDLGLFYGNYSSLTMPPYDDLWPEEFAPKEPLKLLDRKFSRQFRMEQARAFVWGQHPTIANFLPSQFEERAEEIEYAVGLAKLRQRALKYLRDGEMLRPPRVDVPAETLDMSRLSIYAGQQGALKEYEAAFVPVIACAWKAPDGSMAIAVASFTDKPVSFTLELDPQSYVFAEGSRVTYRGLTGERAVDPEIRDGRTLLPVALEASDAGIFEIGLS